MTPNLTRLLFNFVEDDFKDCQVNYCRFMTASEGVTDCSSDTLDKLVASSRCSIDVPHINEPHCVVCNFGGSDYVSVPVLTTDNEQISDSFCTTPGASKAVNCATSFTSEEEVLLLSPSVGTYEQAIASFFGDYACCVDPATCQVYVSDESVEGPSVTQDNAKLFIHSASLDSLDSSYLKCIGGQAIYQSGALKDAS